jgi:hypothetical protein
MTMIGIELPRIILRSKGRPLNAEPSRPIAEIAAPLLATPRLL